MAGCADCCRTDGWDQADLLLLLPGSALQLLLPAGLMLAKLCLTGSPGLHGLSTAGAFTTVVFDLAAGVGSMLMG